MASDENAFPQAASTSDSSLGTMAAVILGLIVLAGLAWYFMRPSVMPVDMNQMMVAPAPEVVSETNVAAPDPVTATLSAQGTSDEVAAIEADLNATDLNAIEADLQGIE